MSIRSALQGTSKPKVSQSKPSGGSQPKPKPKTVTSTPAPAAISTAATVKAPPAATQPPAEKSQPRMTDVRIPSNLLGTPAPVPAPAPSSANQRPALTAAQVLAGSPLPSLQQRQRPVEMDQATLPPPVAEPQLYLSPQQIREMIWTIQNRKLIRGVK